MEDEVPKLSTLTATKITKLKSFKATVVHEFYY
jgi:hypothetical protein